MNLRRLSTMVDREKLPRPERMEPPRSSGKKKNGLVMLSRQGSTFQPTRLRIPINSSSQKITIQPLGHSIAGPSLQLFPTPRTKTNTADDLDGIAVLPSTSRPEQGGRTTPKTSTGTSEPKSRIPKKSGSKGVASGSTKRKSFLVAKKRLSMSKKQTEKRPVDRQLGSPVPPRLSSDSTSQFEADELASAMPTPGRHFKWPSVPPCSCKCTESLQEIKVLHKEMVTSQKELLVKQTKIMDKQSQLIQKQMDVLIKLNTLLDKNINFFNNSVNLNDNEEDMQSTNDKENHSRDANQSVIGERAALLYNDMRSDFNFLSLKTPAKSAGASAVTPKTPKSLLSRTLQMQLGDIFEES